MSYIVLWAHDGDYSPFNTTISGYPSGVDVQSDLKAVEDAVVSVLRQHPEATFRIFDISRELSVQVEIPDAIVKLREIKE